MTMEKAFWLHCDGPDCTNEEPHNFATRESWAVRLDAHRLGWHRSKSGDICPECWEEGVR